MNNNQFPPHGPLDQGPTPEDLEFLRLAREVAALKQSQIDPAITAVLQRLQYFSSPHGGVPLSYPSTNNLESDFDRQLDRIIGPGSTHHFPDTQTNAFDPPDTSNSDDRPFVCYECELRFKRSSDLKRHEKKHFDVLPNICPLCEKGFARKDALKRHIDTLTCKKNRERMQWAVS